MAKSVVAFLVLVLAVFGEFRLSEAERKPVKFYELKKDDFTVKLTNWGATVVSVILPDSKGKLADVVLGFDTLAPYINDTTYFGAIVGRVANRIGGASFSLNGKKYKIIPNEGKNTLHGGHRGFSKVIFTVTEQQGGEFPSIRFTYQSFDGEQGFPGDVLVHVTYKLLGNYQMRIFMQAEALSKPTPINLASHTYWNLAGHDSGDILSNSVQIFGSSITPVDDELIPTGSITPVKGTAYDFLEPHTVGERINLLPTGYDINYVLDGPASGAKMKKAAIVTDSKSGRKLELWTNQPGLQFYTGNMLKDVKGKNGYVYEVHDALCLETQGFPDSVNNPYFPSQIVNPGEVYTHYMLYKFSF